MAQHDQAGVVEPAHPPLTEARAREVTAGLREAMDDVRRSVAVLAARVRDAHAVRVWSPLGYKNWASFCEAEFGISCAQAYRLLDVARALAAIHGAVTASSDLSRTRDSNSGAATALDYGLSQRALIAVSARSGDVAQLITRRLATLTHSRGTPLDEPTVRAVVRQAVHDVRTTTPPPAPENPPPENAPADPALTALRTLVDDLAASTYAIGELMLEVAPAHLSDTEAADVLAPLCDEIGEPLENGLAARRYAISGDRRALDGTVLQSAAVRLPRVQARRVHGRADSWTTLARLKIRWWHTPSTNWSRDSRLPTLRTARFCACATNMGRPPRRPGDKRRRRRMRRRGGPGGTWPGTRRPRSRTMRRSRASPGMRPRRT
ncbi:hypothetical protein [Streptomyces longhuiensis]|uniref:hypothetical protein n=1 Tax=Streptomyces longhuiensis TaxID=2880933 RepID=UPI00311B371F